MRYFAVITLKRADLTEAVVSLNSTPELAQRVGQRIVAAMPRKFVRCRVKEMHLTRGQVRAICHEWGRVDALEGVPLHRTNFPKPYDTAYCRGYRAGLDEARKASDGATNESRRSGPEE